MQLARNIRSEFQVSVERLHLHAVAIVSHKSINENVLRRASKATNERTNERANTSKRHTERKMYVCVRKYDWFSQDWLVTFCVW